MKRTFVVPEDKEVYYEKFKQLVPEVSGELVKFIVDFVNKHEALLAGMTEQTIHDGSETEGIFQGKTFKFQGIELAKGPDTRTPEMYIKVYLTKKGRFLVYRVFTEPNTNETAFKYWYDEPYETYFDMVKKAELSISHIKACEKHLDKNSTIRTYEVLDI